MIHYTTGDILQSEAQALVNTVNTVGVMGKGIALQFKEAFPYNFKIYKEACKSNSFHTGQILAVWDENLVQGRKLILNFPTKAHWRNPSKYEYISSGLEAMKEVMVEQKVESVAIPPLGCGNGGLEWSKVKDLIEKALGELEIDIFVFEPNPHIKAILQNQPSTKKVRLTPARALLLYGLFAFESMGEDSSLFAANKIAWFLQRQGQDMRLQFKPHHYGPYAIGVEKVLYHLNGVYLKGMEQGQIKPFESLKLNYEKWEEVKQYAEEQLGEPEQKRLKGLLHFLNGYTSELSLEILATVDFILTQHPDYEVTDIMEAIRSWNMRKQELFRQEFVEKAYHHIIDNQQTLFQTA